MTERLFTPGPVEVPSRVLEAQARALLHHRTPEFTELYGRVTRRLQDLLLTARPVVVFASSGTGAMEAALVNVTRAGDRIVTVSGGKFGERWGELGRIYGCDTRSLEVEWGRPLEPERLAEAVGSADPRAVFLTHVETSTGVRNDLEALARAVRENRPEALIVVDAITGIGAEDLRTDEWGLDVVVGGSQKGVMTPPGLSYLAASERAEEAARSNDRGRYYFDLPRSLDALAKGTSPFTPAISLLCGLDVALAVIEEEGREACLARHRANARACRAACRAIDLEIFPSRPARCETVFRIPEGLTDERIRGTLLREHRIRVAGGQAKLKGRVIRLGHLGHYRPDDIRYLCRRLETVMIALGHAREEGRALAAIRSEEERSET
jgi:aspartate aminotransferase-like enzyme